MIYSVFGNYDQLAAGELALTMPAEYQSAAVVVPYAREWVAYLRLYTDEILPHLRGLLRSTNSIALTIRERDVSQGNNYLRGCAYHGATALSRSNFEQHTWCCHEMSAFYGFESEVSSAFQPAPLFACHERFVSTCRKAACLAPLWTCLSATVERNSADNVETRL